MIRVIVKAISFDSVIFCFVRLFPSGRTRRQDGDGGLAEQSPDEGGDAPTGCGLVERLQASN